MPRVGVNGVELHYEEQGEETPVLGVHGTPGAAILWADAAKELALHGRCIIYDRRGFHRSAPPVPFRTLDLVDHVDDAAALLAALHAGPAVVIGHGTGGLIAIELTRRFPDKVKSLVLLEPALFTIDPAAEAWARDLRRKVLERSAARPELLAETMIREALGNGSWETLPDELQQTVGGTGHAVLAEIRGHRMDLSEDAGAGRRRTGRRTPANSDRVRPRLPRGLPAGQRPAVGRFALHPDGPGPRRTFHRPRLSGRPGLRGPCRHRPRRLGLAGPSAVRGSTQTSLPGGKQEC